MTTPLPSRAPTSHSLPAVEQAIAYQAECLLATLESEVARARPRWSFLSNTIAQAALALRTCATLKALPSGRVLDVLQAEQSLESWLYSLAAPAIRPRVLSCISTDECSVGEELLPTVLRLLNRNLDLVLELSRRKSPSPTELRRQQDIAQRTLLLLLADPKVRHLCEASLPSPLMTSVSVHRWLASQAPHSCSAT